MRAGKAIRDAARDEAWVCPNRCGHPSIEHRERPYGSAGYAPLRFYCHYAGCTCVHEVKP